MEYFIYYLFYYIATALFLMPLVVCSPSKKYRSDLSVGHSKCTHGSSRLSALVKNILNLQRY